VRIAGDAPNPALRMRGRRNAIERRVDLDRVEEVGQIGERIESRTVRRIDSSLPIGVTPAGGNDAYLVLVILSLSLGVFHCVHWTSMLKANNEPNRNASH